MYSDPPESLSGSSKANEDSEHKGCDPGMALENDYLGWGQGESGKGAGSSQKVHSPKRGSYYLWDCLEDLGKIRLQGQAGGSLGLRLSWSKGEYKPHAPRWPRRPGRPGLCYQVPMWCQGPRALQTGPSSACCGGGGVCFSPNNLTVARCGLLASFYIIQAFLLSTRSNLKEP